MTQSYDELLAKAATSIKSKKPEAIAPIYRVDSIFSLVITESSENCRYSLRATVINDKNVFGRRGFLAAPNGLAFFSGTNESVMSRWAALNLWLRGNSVIKANRLISVERFHEMFKTSGWNSRILREGGRLHEPYALFTPYSLESIKRANISREAFSTD